MRGHCIAEQGFGGTLAHLSGGIPTVLGTVEQQHGRGGLGGSTALASERLAPALQGGSYLYAASIL